MTQFNATARINVDLSGFARASSQATSSTGAWTAATNSLQSSLSHVETISKQQATQLNRTLGVYQKMTSAVGGYANAVSKLEKVNNENAASEKKFQEALGSLKTALSGVEGLSKKEAERLTRTVDLYVKLAKAVDTYANALLKMESLGSRAAADQQKQEQATARNEATQQRLAQTEARLAQSQQRLEQSEARLAQTQSRMTETGQQAAGAFDHISASTFALRSTLGELEQSYQSLLRVLVAIPTASAGAAISQESAYAQVARVVGDADANANNLYRGLQKISTDLPIDFQTTASIAQLGAQIGITADQLISFTRTVAAFSITTGISSDEVTLLLGQIKEMEDIPVTEIDNYASAVLKLGTVSAATEDEILKVNDSIATVANVFGLTTQATLGLSSAFATLRVRPELARGSLTRVFGQLEDAVDGSGDALEALSHIMGLTADEVKNLRATDPDDFFLRFIQGLQNASKSGTSFRSALRDLGITAVRDIDTISRLANNYDVLSDSVNLANAEYGRNQELEKQSQRIYNTTANRLGNLSDAFQNFLANAGKPLASLVGTLAKAGSSLIDFVNTVPEVGIVIGGVASAVVVGGAAWVAYRLALIKTLTTIVAYKESQAQLQGQSISLSTVLKTLRQDVSGNAIAAEESAVATASAASANAALADSASAAGAATAGLTGELSAAGASGTRAAAGSAAAAAATADLAVAQQGAFFTAEELTISLAEVAAAAGAVATEEQLVLFTTTELAGANAGVAATAQAAAVAEGELAVATNGLKISMAGLLGIVGVVGIAAAYLLPAFLNSKSASQELNESVIQTAGGLGELSKAIEDDTQAAKSGGPAYSKLTVTYGDLDKTTRDATKSTIASAKAQKDAITLVHGTVQELQKQAKGHGEGAEAAKSYLAQIANANETIKSNTQLLKENTVILGDNAKKWLENAFDAAAQKSAITKNADALKILKSTSLDVGSTLTKALRDPKGASADLDKAIAQVDAKLRDLKSNGASGTSLVNWADSVKDAQQADLFLKALKSSVGALGDETAATAVKNQIFGDQLAATPQQAALAAKGFGDVSTALQAMGDGADASEDDMTALQQTIAGFGTPLDAFKSAFEDATASTKKNSADAKSALDAFSNGAVVSLDKYEQQLDKILKAQANWAANIVVLAQRLGPDIASELANLGPEAAPMIQKFVDASDAELKKLKPRLEATTDSATSAMSATILAAIPGIQGASKKTATVISDALVNQLEAGKVPFQDTLNDFARLVTALDKAKGKPKVELQTSDAKKSLADLLVLVQGTSSSGKLDPKGTAQLNTQIFNDKANALKGQTATDSRTGKYDPKGTAKLDPSPYNNQRDRIIKELQNRERAGYFDPRGRAKLNTDTFYAQMANLRSASLNTGRTIQANLTRSATVSVGYFYYSKNSPPKVPKTMAAADGGWVNGIGGPRDDKNPYMLSNKEFIVNAAAAQQYAPLLEAINRFGGQGGGSSAEAISGAAFKTNAVPVSTSTQAPDRAKALTSSQPGRPQTYIQVTNYYPQAEPTSKTVNRSLAFAASLDGTL